MNKPPTNVAQADDSPANSNANTDDITDDNITECFFIEEFSRVDAELTFLASMPASTVSSKISPPKDTPAYLAHLWRTPTLTPQQEQHCFRKLNFLKHRYLETVQRGSDADQMELQTLKQQIDQARNFLVESNLRLVVSIAKRHAVTSTDRFEELICVGNTAVLRSVDLFDFRRGTKFSTYAYQSIRRAMFDLFRREQRFQVKIVGGDSRELENFCSDAGESDRVVAEATEAIARAHSLIQALDERDRHIVRARFGMGSTDRKTAFHVIAKQVNLSTTRTVQRFNNSIARMRSTADAMKMTFS